MALLKGKTAVITGGTTGIGLATAKRFVEEGAYVFITGRRQAELEAAVEELGEYATGVQGDVSKPEDLDRLYSAVAESGRRLDVVFANAAILEAARIGEITDEQLDYQLGVDFKGVVFTVQKSLPLLNDVQAAGLTPMQLAASISDKLKKDVSDPRVTVVVTAMNSQRIYMLGEVTHTGAMPLIPNMTVLQALASAGFTQFANTKGIYILRTENGKQQKIPFNYKQVIKGESMEQNIPLKPGDTIVVP